MRYNELNTNEKLFGKDYLVYDWIEADTKIHIYIKSLPFIKNSSIPKLE